MQRRMGQKTERERGGWEMRVWEELGEDREQRCRDDGRPRAQENMIRWESEKVGRLGEGGKARKREGEKVPTRDKRRRGEGEKERK